MDSKDFSANLKKLSNALIVALPVINEKVAVNAYALMRQRVIERGTIGEDQPLGTYSENPLPAFYFKDKALNNSGEAAYQKAKKSGEGISYADWRRVNNRPTDHVTLSFSGTTLNDIGVIKALQEGTKIITIVGAKNAKTRKSGKTTSDIIGYLQEQYGDFIKPNKQETELLKRTLTSEVNKVIKQNI
jgi:hypothetical protein